MILFQNSEMRMAVVVWWSSLWSSFRIGDPVSTWSAPVFPRCRPLLGKFKIRRKPAFFERIRVQDRILARTEIVCRPMLACCYCTRPVSGLSASLDVPVPRQRDGVNRLPLPAVAADDERLHDCDPEQQQQIYN